MRRDWMIGAATAALLVLAACGGESTGPEPQPVADPEAASDPLGLTSGIVVPGTLSEDPGPARPRGTCRFDETDRRWKCAPFTRGGLTFSRSFAFLDATGTGMRNYDRQLTEAINTRTGVRGIVPLQNGGTTAVQRSADITVSGLLGEETQHVINGTEGGTVRTVIPSDQGRVTLETVSADTTTNLTFDVPRARGSWPRGTTVRNVTITQSIEGATPSTRSTWRRELTTFDGTEIAQVVITTPEGSRSCTRNLATGQSTCGGTTR